jgi:hypothetical protein
MVLSSSFVAILILIFSALVDIVEVAAPDVAAPLTAVILLFTNI